METPSKANLELEEVITYNKKQMALEMMKSSPSDLKLKQFLDSTREIRKKEVNTIPGLRIMHIYPALKKPDLVQY